MFAEVIPLARLPKKLSRFDYEVPQEIEGQIKLGQIVLVPFRGKRTKGVVVNLKDRAAELKMALKKIKKILSEDPVIDETGLALLQWMSEYYVSSLPLLLKTFIPEPPLRKLGESRKTGTVVKDISIAKSDLPEIKNSLKNILGDKEFSLYFYKKSKNKTIVLLKCAERTVNSGKTVLLLLPQVTDIAGALPYFMKLFPREIAVLHGELSKTDYWQEWQKIKSGKARIVIGTRSALFAPLRDLGLIIIDNEEASDFKQSDQNPRYDARDVAFKLSKITGAKIVSASQAPRPETYFLAKNQPGAIFLAPQNNPASVALVDMNDEIKNKNFSPLSEKIREGIELALDKNKKIILLLNRRGSSTLILCRDCDYVFKCEKCQAPLACCEDVCNLPSKFICRNCGREKPVHLKCPNCHGAAIKYLGTGTQTVEREMRKLFPRAKVLRIDKDAKIAKIVKEFGQASIFIGTQFFIRNYLERIRDIGFLGIISADTLTYSPNFRSAEKTFSWLMKLINFAGETKSPVCVQTFFPNNYFIQAVIRGNPEIFYNEELDNRMSLGYPPFSRLAKLVYADFKEEICVNEASHIYNELSGKLNGLAEMSINEKPRMENKKFFSKIILKFPEDSSGKVKEIIRKALPDEWTIDIDPESLL
jgi:primosomal protein N' (replication factor Y)